MYLYPNKFKEHNRKDNDEANTEEKWYKYGIHKYYTEKFHARNPRMDQTTVCKRNAD